MITNNQHKIINMFDDIAGSYDIVNRVLSLGIDTRWRNEVCRLALQIIGNNKAINILDMACGTGDMINCWLKYANNVESLIGIDPSSRMLDIARLKLPKQIILVKGEAKSIDLPSSSVDLLSIAYGLRNVVELDDALVEFNRVLKKDGLLVILEFTRKDKQNIFDKLALFYTVRVLPLIGGLISRNYKAYKYLPDSIRDFLTLEELENRLSKCGFALEVKKRYFCNLCSFIIVKKR